MTQHKKLKKIIAYAVKRKWYNILDEEKIEWVVQDWGEIIVEPSAGSDATRYDLFTWLLSQDFAIAFFGEEPYIFPESMETGVFFSGNIIAKEDSRWELDCPSWHYHLQQMVISEDPIEYCYKFILKIGGADK